MKAIAFRRKDGPGLGTGLTVPAFSATLELFAGHSPRGPSDIEDHFTLNRGADHTMVVPRTTINFPSVPYRVSNDYPFTYRIPLQQPFTFLASGVGMLELALHDSTACPVQGLGWDFQWDIPPASRTPAIPFGTSCPPGANMLGPTDYLYVGNPAGLMLGGTPWIATNSSAAVCAGLSSNSWSGLALPYDLGALGAPGCFVNVSLDTCWAMDPIANTGFYRARADLPNDPRLVGSVLYFQGVRFNWTSNPLGIETSNGLDMLVGPHRDPEMSMLFGDWGGLDWGDMQIGAGPVTQLEFR